MVPHRHGGGRKRVVTRASISTPPWELERHRRGTIRWYQFDTLLPAGLASAGSVRTLVVPTVNLSTGAATATPQNRGVEQTERALTGALAANIWQNPDGLNYWGREHHLTCWCGVAPSILTTGHLYVAVFLQQPGANGLPPMPANPTKPQCVLRYARDAGGVPNERFELITAVGDATPFKLSVLANVPGPVSDLTAPDGMQRFEIIYKPGVYVKALIDGKLGAVHTDHLPKVTTIPANLQFMAGTGTYLEAATTGDNAVGFFAGLMIETYRV